MISLEKIAKHQRKIAGIAIILTVLAVEETYVGFGREICSNLYKRYEEFLDRNLAPKNLYPKNF